MKLQCPTIINGMRNNMKMPPGAQERHTKNVSCQQGGDGSQVSSGCQQGERGVKNGQKTSYDLRMIPNENNDRLDMYLPCTPFQKLLLFVHNKIYFG